MVERLFEDAPLYFAARTRDHWIWLNRYWELSLGWSRSDFGSKPPWTFVHPADRTLRDLAGNVRVRMRTRRNDYRWLHWMPPLHVEGTIYYVCARDVTDEEALRDHAFHDPTTGLNNRRYFDDAIKREITRAQRTRTALALSLIDVDHFKAINDTFGHIAGDNLLSEFGKILRSSFRDDDIVARYGGEEFAVILPACTRTEAIARIDSLRRDVGEALPIRFSAGVVQMPYPCTVTALLHAADRALYRAKETGRDRVCWA